MLSDYLRIVLVLYCIVLYCTVLFNILTLPCTTVSKAMEFSNYKRNLKILCDSRGFRFSLEFLKVRFG